MTPETITPLPVKIGPASGHIAVRRWTTPGASGQVICLHGLGVSGAEFAVLAERLNRSGLDVVCPDWIGHGESSYFGVPDAYRSYWSVQTLVQILPKLYQPGRTHLLSASFGAIIAFVFASAARIPFRSIGFVDLPLMRNPATAGYSDNLAQIVGHRFVTVEDAEARLKQLRPRLFDHPESHRAYFRQARFQIGDGYATIKCDGAVLKGSGLDSSIPFDLRPQITRLPCPTYYLFGMHSPFRDRDLFERAMTTAPHVHYRDDLDAGHPPCLLKADETDAVAGYLERF